MEDWNNLQVEQRLRIEEELRKLGIQPRSKARDNMVTIWKHKPTSHTGVYEIRMSDISY